MYSYRPLTEHDVLLRNVSNLTDDKNQRNQYWTKVKQEISNFDKYCLIKYSRIQHSLFNLISCFTEPNANLDNIESEADLMRELIIKFNDQIGLNFKFFVRLRHKFLKLGKNNEKKHSASEFADQMIKKYKFCNIGMGDFICMLSDIYYTVAEKRKEREAELMGKTGSTWVPPSAFVRSTRKYWVRLEDLTRLKLHICKHLPLLRFGKRQGVHLGEIQKGAGDYSQYDNSYNSNGEGDAAKITSVYFDNDKLRLYHDKIVRKEGATLIRIRWYGDEGKTCFMERKTWHDSWVLNDSIKERFDLKWNEVPNFISGHLSPDAFVENLRGIGKYDYNTLCEILGLASTVQSRILKLQLHPAIRTTYMRTAFQNSDNNSIRISIDTSLELSFEPRDPGPGRWCRNGSLPIPPSEKFVFPMAVLEIKLHSISDIPEWIQQIVNADYVVSAYKFSKFMHGTAKLNGLNTKVLPPWFNRTCTHIPGHNLKNWYRQSTELVPNKMDFDGVAKWESLQEYEIPQYKLVNSNLFEGKDSDYSSSEEEDSENNDLEDDEKSVKLVLLGEAGNKSTIRKRRPTPVGGIRVMKMNGMVDDEQEIKWRAADGLKPLPTVELSGTVENGGPNLLSVYSMPKKPKRAGITPVLQAIRYEPKTNFALERTFLNWQRLFAFLSAISITYALFSPLPHLFFVLNIFCIAMIICFYGLLVYLIRRKAIRVRSVDGHYDDKYGPTILVACIVICIIVVISWEFHLAYLVPYINPLAQPWTRDYRVPISATAFDNNTISQSFSIENEVISSTLGTILMDLKKALPQFTLFGSLVEKGSQIFSLWDTMGTCRLYRNGYRLRAITGKDSFGDLTTNMGLEFFTWDTQLLALMATSFPEANYHNAEYFRPPDNMYYAREKILPIVPGWDISRLVNVAQLFEPYYLWDAIDNTSLNEPIYMVGGMQLQYVAYGDVQINLGVYNKYATLSAYIWYKNFIPAYAELSLSYPVIPGQNLTAIEILNARTVYGAIKNLGQAIPQNTDIADYVYGLGFCT